MPVKGEHYTTTDSHAERQWQLGRLRTQQYRSSGSEERKEMSAGGSSTAGKANSVDEK